MSTDPQFSYGDRIVRLETILKTLEKAIDEIRANTKETASAISDLRYIRQEIANLRAEINKLDARLGKRDDDYDLAMNRIIALEKESMQKVADVIAEIKKVESYVNARWWALAAIVAAITAIINIGIRLFF